MEPNEQEFTEGFDEASNEIETGIATEEAEAVKDDNDATKELEGQGKPEEKPPGEEDDKEDEPKPEDDDKSKEGEGAEKKPDEETVPKQKYNSMMGRLQKLQRQHNELVKNLTPGDGKEGVIKKKTDIPEEQWGAIGDFKKRYPQYADHIEVDGDEGDRLRDLLEEHGPDVAAIKIENMQLMEGSKKQAKSAENVQKIKQSEAEIERVRIMAEAHPEEAEIFFGDDKSAVSEFVGKIEAWVGSMPYSKAVEYKRIIDTGTPQEVNKLLTDYKEANKQKPKPPDKAVEDALAVPTKKTVTPKTKASKDDFEGGFAEEAERLAKER